MATKKDTNCRRRLKLPQQNLDSIGFIQHGRIKQQISVTPSKQLRGGQQCDASFNLRP